MHDGLATLTMISRDMLQIAIQFDYFFSEEACIHRPSGRCQTSNTLIP